MSNLLTDLINSGQLDYAKAMGLTDQQQGAGFASTTTGGLSAHDWCAQQSQQISGLQGSLQGGLAGAQQWQGLQGGLGLGDQYTFTKIGQEEYAFNISEFDRQWRGLMDNSLSQGVADRIKGLRQAANPPKKCDNCGQQHKTVTWRDAGLTKLCKWCCGSNKGEVTYSRTPFWRRVLGWFRRKPKGFLIGA